MFLYHQSPRATLKAAVAAALLVLVSVTGCAPSYYQLRYEGQQALLNAEHGTARRLFKQADDKRPRAVDNLHDLGVCSVLLARAQFEQMNHAAALREVDEAIAYYTRAIDVHPGHQASLEGRNIALRLKGQFDEALESAEWAARFVGPSAQQYIFLARELEQRGDVDGAYLRYRQAVAMEPGNAVAHTAFARFLIKEGNERAAVYHLRVAYRLNPLEEWVTAELIARGALPALAEPPAEAP